MIELKLVLNSDARPDRIRCAGCFMTDVAGLKLLDLNTLDLAFFFEILIIQINLNMKYTSNFLFCFFLCLSIAYGVGNITYTDNNVTHTASDHGTQIYSSTLKGEAAVLGGTLGFAGLLALLVV